MKQKKQPVEKSSIKKLLMNINYLSLLKLLMDKY